MSDRPEISRVLVNADGTAISESRAAGLFPKLKIAIIFIRSDGWTLAAPLNLADAAYKLWDLEWVQFWEDGKVYPIEELATRKFRASESTLHGVVF